MIRTQGESFDDSHAITIFSDSAGQDGAYALQRVLKPGDIIGGSYKLESLLGQGGMGLVFRAVHTKMGSEYALKMLAPEQLNESARARFESEGRSIARLDHINIVKVYNMGVDGATNPFYVMDLLDGEALSDYITRRKSLDFEEALSITQQITAGLGYAHSKGIVHRDIKPSNIILLGGQTAQKKIAKIVDFGIAKVLSSATASSQSQTNAGDVFGSPLYMSPEQSMGGSVDQRSDIYSLGCTFFEMLTGKTPYHGENALQTILMHQNEALPDFYSLARDKRLPETLPYMLEKMLAKNPKNRYQSMTQLDHDLQRLREGKIVGTAYGGEKIIEETNAESKKSTAQKTILAASALLVMSGLAFYFVVNQKPAMQGIAPVTVMDPAKEASVDNLLNDMTDSTQKKEVDQSIEASSEDLTPIVSTICTVRKVKHRRFVFPQKALGAVFDQDGAWSQGLKVAKGIVLTRADWPLTLIVGESGDSANALKSPEVFKRIGLNEFERLYISEPKAARAAMLIDENTNKYDLGIEDLLETATKWTKLNRLGLRDVPLTINVMQGLNKCKHMDCLYLSNCSFDGPLLARQPFLGNVKAIYFEECTNLTKVFEALSKSSSLSCCDLSRSRFTANDLKLLGRSKCLKSLFLSACVTAKADAESIEPSSSNSSGIPSIDSLIPAIASFDHPIELCIKDKDVTFAQIKNWLACKKVYRIGLYSSNYPLEIQKSWLSALPKGTLQFFE